MFVVPKNCVVNPCLNGGTCLPVSTTGDYQCKCPPGFQGKFCQLIDSPSPAGTAV